MNFTLLNNKVLLLVGLFFTLLISACEKGESFPVDSGNGNTINRKLTLTAYHYYITSEGIKDTLLPYVDVELYDDTTYRNIRQNRIKWGQTNSNGELTIEYLSVGVYYLFAEHNNLEEKINLDINIPEASVNAYEEIRFTTN